MIRSPNRQRFRSVGGFGGVVPLGLAGAVALLACARQANANDVGSPASSAASTDDDPWWGRDKALHLGVSVGLAAGGYGVSSIWLDRAWQRASAGAAFSLTLGAGKELLDSAGYGQASYKDMLYNLAGTALGVTLAYLVDLATGKGMESNTESQRQGLGSRRPLVAF